MLYWLLFLLVVFVLWVLIVWFAQRSILYPRFILTRPIEPHPPAGVEVWQHEIPAGQVEAWFLAGEGVDADRPGPAVIFAHGNGELIDDWPDLLVGYRRLGVSVLLPEYRGYGRSAGSPAQDAITRDFTAFYDRLADRPEVDPDRIVFHGRSLGSGVVAGLAQHRPPAALILQSAFTSAADLARGFFVPRLLMRDPYDVLPVVQNYPGPVLILHGRDDELIPYTHANRLHAAAPDSELIFYDVGHNDLPPARAYWADIERFLRRADVLPPE